MARTFRETSHPCTCLQRSVPYDHQMSANGTTVVHASQSGYQIFLLKEGLTSSAQTPLMFQPHRQFYLCRCPDLKYDSRILTLAIESHPENMQRNSHILKTCKKIRTSWKHARKFAHPLNLFRSDSCKHTFAVSKVAVQVSSISSQILQILDTRSIIHSTGFCSGFSNIFFSWLSEYQ